MHFHFCNIGIGNLPDAVLHKLYNHKDLGFHSEMMSDTVVNLTEKGALTNAKKAIQTGKIVASFAMGTKKLYNFLDDNSFVCKLFKFYANVRKCIIQLNLSLWPPLLSKQPVLSKHVFSSQNNQTH